MALPYSWKQFIQRVRKHMNNGFPNDAWATTDNELLLYIAQAMAVQIKTAAYENAKVEGVLVVPEASLPLGYSVNRVYFAQTAFGASQEVYPVKAKRVGYRLTMPLPTGARYWIENNLIWLAASNGQPLVNQTLYIQMPSVRTSDITLPMNLPDDAAEAIFMDVTNLLTARYKQPKDIVRDELPAGNNSLKS